MWSLLDRHKQVNAFKVLIAMILGALSSTLGGLIVHGLAVLVTSEMQNGFELVTLMPIIGVIVFTGQKLVHEMQKLHQSITLTDDGSKALDKGYSELGSGRMPLPVYGAAGRVSLKRALKLQDLSYSYSRANRRGINQVSLSIQAGERLGIVGDSRAGKTTLIDRILGLVTPDTGRIAASKRTT
ncbi:MAG: ATP-binding cassette domain-containing protein [Pseudomonadota bacterium]